MSNKALAGLERLRAELAALGFEGHLSEVKGMRLTNDEVRVAGWAVVSGEAVASFAVALHSDRRPRTWSRASWPSGCTDEHACRFGCLWARQGLCSACVCRPVIDALNPALRELGFIALGRTQGIVIDAIELVAWSTINLLVAVIDKQTARGRRPDGRWAHTRGKLLSRDAEDVVCGWTDREHDDARWWALAELSDASAEAGNPCTPTLPAHLTALEAALQIHFSAAHVLPRPGGGVSSSQPPGPPSATAEPIEQQRPMGSTTAVAAPSPSGEGGGVAITSVAAPQLLLGARPGEGMVDDDAIIDDAGDCAALCAEPDEGIAIDDMVAEAVAARADRNRLLALRLLGTLRPSVTASAGSALERLLAECREVVGDDPVACGVRALVGVIGTGDDTEAAEATLRAALRGAAVATGFAL